MGTEDSEREILTIPRCRGAGELPPREAEAQGCATHKLTPKPTTQSRQQ